MRAPSAEVLRRHWEDVHETAVERATNSLVETTGGLGASARSAYRKIRRSMSMRPAPAASADAANAPPAAPPIRRAALRRSSLPPPAPRAFGAQPGPDDGPAAFLGKRWRQHAVV